MNRRLFLQAFAAVTDMPKVPLRIAQPRLPHFLGPSGINDALRGVMYEQRLAWSSKSVWSA